MVELIFEADFQAGSVRISTKADSTGSNIPKAKAIVEEKTRIIDLDLSADFDNVQHYLLLEKVARRLRMMQFCICSR